MLRKTTNQIMNACLHAATAYDNVCRGFLGTPGQDGINRKVEFLKLVSELYQNTPEEAFIKVYDFYLLQSQTSRLSRIIENILMGLLDIPEPIFTGNRYEYILAVSEAESLFHTKAAAVKADMGMTDDKNEIPLMNVMRKNR